MSIFLLYAEYINAQFRSAPLSKQLYLIKFLVINQVRPVTMDKSASSKPRKLSSSLIEVCGHISQTMQDHRTSLRRSLVRQLPRTGQSYVDTIGANPPSQRGPPRLTSKESVLLDFETF